MIRREQIIATTHVDRHRERIVLSGLESLVEATNQSYVPVIVGHDPRSAPIGRMAESRIEELEDGEHAVVATYEIFEPGDGVESIPGREIPTRAYEHGQVQLSFDRSYRDDESQNLISEISDLLGSQAQEQGKKAVEPISVLMVGAAVALGAVATGFLNALGADVYDVVKAKLKKLCVLERGQRDEQLLRFEFAVSEGSRLVNVDVIFTNPSEDDLDYALGSMLKALDEHLPRLFSETDEIRRIVFEATDGQLYLKFAVRWDAVPVFPHAELGHPEQLDSAHDGRENPTGFSEPEDELNVG